VTRKPPRPSTWNSPKGTCRFCGEAIIENGKQNLRKNWHKECVGIWLVMSDPREARRHVWKRESGICQGCEKDLHDSVNETSTVLWQYHQTWEADHHQPLWEAEGDLSFWHPDNLRLLCSDCHLVKTKEEATRRALTKKNKKLDE
jgi:hypothetical protein